MRRAAIFGDAYLPDPYDEPLEDEALVAAILKHGYIVGFNTDIVPSPQKRKPSKQPKSQPVEPSVVVEAPPPSPAAPEPPVDPETIRYAELQSEVLHCELGVLELKLGIQRMTESIKAFPHATEHLRAALPSARARLRSAQATLRQRRQRLEQTL